MRINDMRHGRYYAAVEAGGAPPAEAEVTPPPDPVAAPPPAAVTPAPVVEQRQMTDAEMQDVLARRGFAVVPAQQAQQLQQVERERQVEAENREIERLADLQMTDPPAWQREMMQRQDRVATQRASELMAEQRQLQPLAQQIISSVRSAVPDLPESEYAEITAQLANPNVTTANMQAAITNGTVVTWAKARVHDLQRDGKIAPPSTRPPNEAGAPPSRPTDTVSAATRSKAEVMAERLGIPVAEVLAGLPKGKR